MTKVIEELVELIKENSTIIAFILAPFITIVLWVLADMLIDQEAYSRLDPLSGFLMTYIFILIPTLTVGAGAYLLTKRLGLVTWWTATLTGLINGAIVCYLFNFITFVYILIGGLNGFLFWLIWSTGHKAGSGRKSETFSAQR